MGKVYVGQTAFAIRRITGVDLSSVLSTVLKYKKPDGSAGQWTATVYNAARGIVEYIIASASDLDQVGAWTIWSYVTFADGNSAPGEASTLEVFEEGT